MIVEQYTSEKEYLESELESKDEQIERLFKENFALQNFKERSVKTNHIDNDILKLNAELISKILLYILLGKNKTMADEIKIMKKKLLEFLSNNTEFFAKNTKTENELKEKIDNLKLENKQLRDITMQLQNDKIIKENEVLILKGRIEELEKEYENSKSIRCKLTMNIKILQSSIETLNKKLLKMEQMYEMCMNVVSKHLNLSSND